MQNEHERGREGLDRIGLIREGAEVYFDFEKLNVYQRALDFAHFVFDRCKTFDSAYRSSLADQLQRAALSIGTNIAEGCGKASRREKIKYYSYALDSAKECMPCVTLALRQRQMSEEDGNRARGDCTVICRMLARLIQSVENEELRKDALTS